MSSLEILELMWAGMASVDQHKVLPYADMDLDPDEADQWLFDIQHKGLCLSTFINNYGFYEPCLRERYS